MSVPSAAGSGFIKSATAPIALRTDTCLSALIALAPDNKPKSTREYRRTAAVRKLSLQASGNARSDRPPQTSESHARVAAQHINPGVGRHLDTTLFASPVFGRRQKLRAHAANSCVRGSPSQLGLHEFDISGLSLVHCISSLYTHDCAKAIAYPSRSRHNIYSLPSALEGL